MISLVAWNRPTQKNFLKSRFVIFRCQKYVKKWYIEIGKKIYLGPIKSALCRSDLNNFFLSLVAWNRPTQKTFLKSRFVIFRCQKYIKKRVHRNRKKKLPWALKKCPGSLYLPLLTKQLNLISVKLQNVSAM